MSGSPGDYGFRPDFCEAADPESKGIVENLVGYAKGDLMLPQAPFVDLAAAEASAAAWCAEVNGAVHSEICAVPAERLAIGRELLASLQPLRASIGRKVTLKVGRLSYGSARPATPRPSECGGGGATSVTAVTGPKFLGVSTHSLQGALSPEVGNELSVLDGTLSCVGIWLTPGFWLNAIITKIACLCLIYPAMRR
jgi:hypothetical protein